MTIRVGVVGYDLIGKRVADAVSLQEDMAVVGVVDDDPRSRILISASGFAALQGGAASVIDLCDVVVTSVGEPHTGRSTVVRNSCAANERAVLFSPMSTGASVFGQPCVRIASVDVFAVSRIVASLSTLAKIERIYSNVITRVGHATESAAGSADALEPIFDDNATMNELAQVLMPMVAKFDISRVRAPYTHSNLHMMALDFAKPVQRRSVLEALDGTARILVASASDGFVSTAHIQEFLRESRRRRFDRPELFVWEESVVARGRRLYLMYDVSPEAAPIPETIDAIRLSRTEGLELAESMSRTDAGLGIGRLNGTVVKVGPDCRTGPAATNQDHEPVFASRFRPAGGTCNAPSKVRVGIMGYGVIGRRVADAIRLQDDMLVVGIAGRPTSFSLRDADLKGYDVFVTSEGGPGDAAHRFCEIRGSLEDLLNRCLVLLDCTPSGVPGEYNELYERFEGVTVIVQGGEKHDFGGVSFNAFANYHEVLNRKRIRVISCSSTGTTRFVFALHKSFGVESAFVALARRAADPAKPGKTPYNALKPKMGQSHHAPDVSTVLPGLDLFSVSVDIPTTYGHIISFRVDLERAVARREVLDALHATPRILVGSGLRSTADLAEYFQDLGRSRRDRPELYVWEESVRVDGATVYAAVSVHMESITIPETVDCVRAALGLEDNHWVSIRKTDRALGIEKSIECYERRPT